MKLFVVSFLVFVSFSCSEQKKENTINSKTNVDSLSSPVIDSSNVKIVLPDTSEQNSQEQRIVKKYGKQWEFCECIKKIDSLNKQSQKEGLSNEKLESILLEFDRIEKKCKSILSNSSHTPAQRKKHEKRVKDCLKN
tara:strand:- start:305 stop:715 length:411 start_codon:yes stop_codon:yes gene_type:complete